MKLFKVYYPKPGAVFAGSTDPSERERSAMARLNNVNDMAEPWMGDHIDTEYELVHEGMMADDGNAETIWELYNLFGAPETDRQRRSMCTGDVVEFDGSYQMAVSVGFEAVKGFGPDMKITDAVKPQR